MSTADGILDERDLTLPGLERFSKGPVAVIECIEEIPCNPCVEACPKHAISMATVTGLPALDPGRCNGCGLCLSHCPGLAIFWIDESRPDRDLVGIPYELLPLPEPEEEVLLFDRAGNACGRGRVERIWNRPSLDRTAVVFVAASKGLAMKVRHLRRIG
jgi:Fe-S-cluster-containing hydrogenase component 2